MLVAACFGIYFDLHNREMLLPWIFRAVPALPWSDVVPWLGFSLFAVAGFSLVICHGHLDWDLSNLKAGDLIRMVRKSVLDAL